MNIFLLIGQSNMAGRGRLEDCPALSDPRVMMYRGGVWMQAVEPIHTDKPELAGIGLSMRFAVELVSRGFMAPIGLVPCAVGGTPLSRWMPGADLYENAVAVTKQALVGGTLKGVLWHQGEGESGEEERARTYATRFSAMIASLRGELNADDVPVIAGELGDFLEKRHPGCFYKTVNSQLRALEGTLPRYACVSAEGLTDNGDNLHFNSASLREFGLRYANAYMKMSGG